VHKPGGIHVDQASPEDIGAHQHLARAAFELREIELRRRRASRRRLEVLDTVGGEEHVAAGDPRHQAGHGRATITEIESRDYVLNAPEALPRRVEQRATDK
jgi:hypothetical protein